jgi:hypothetical protein
MIYPMRRFGLNAAEAFLTIMGMVISLLLLAGAIAAGIWNEWFHAEGFLGGVLISLMAAAGLLMNLGSGGIRQNRPAFDVGLTLTTLGGLGWIIRGIIVGAWVPAITGIALLLMFFLCWLARREGIRSRFNPRFFSLRQFETMVQIADVMLDADDLKLHPIEVAIRTDHFLAEIDSPVKKDIRLVMFLVEWVTPLLIARFFPFSDLGTNERRRIVERVIWARGPFRDVGRTLKLLSTFTYYTHPEARESIGYVEFDRRSRSAGVDQSPKHYPLPNNGSPATPPPPFVQESLFPQDEGGPQ